MIKVLVVTSCTNEKRFKPKNQLQKDDFKDPVILASREQELEHYRLKARDMYTGAQHLRLYEGVSILRRKYGEKVVDVAILSAGYGLVSEDDTVVPYEMTFSALKVKELLEWSNHLDIPARTEQVIKGYDLVFFLLGKNYLRALQLPFSNIDPAQRLIFLCGESNRRLIGGGGTYHVVPLGPGDAKRFGYGLIGLKGYLFKLFAHEAVKDSGLLGEVYQNPERFLQYLNSPAQFIGQTPLPEMETDQQGKLPSRPIIDYYIPQEDYASNIHKGMIYFIPESDDLVDPNYDFITDSSDKKRRPHTDDYYAHQFFADRPNYNGILVSKSNIETGGKKKGLIEEIGLREYIRFPREKGLLMGDCGAWIYVEEEFPPYDTLEILNYYERLQFDIGVSIDHLIKPGLKNIAERDRRYKLTLDNAKLFIDQYRLGKYSFIPSGIAQGWDPLSYRDAVKDLLDMGYGHISIGGLAGEQRNLLILDIMKIIRPIIPENVDVHLFGVGRLDLLMAVHKLGITAFDSSRPLRQAWGGASSNYYTSSGKNYSAIRVPPVDYEGGTINQKIKASKDQEGTYRLFKEKEQLSLKRLRLYDQGKIGLEETLEAILDYDKLIGDGREKHARLYREVLTDMPWKHCDCSICREIGIEVIIFRGNNRNRRRGFHNTYVFYNRFLELKESVNR